MSRTRSHRREMPTDAAGESFYQTLGQRIAAQARRIIAALWGEGQRSPLGAILGLCMLGLLVLLAASIYQEMAAAIFHVH